MMVVGALVSVFGRFPTNKMANFYTSVLLIKIANLVPRFKKN
jgi:hypothetical protein